MNRRTFLRTAAGIAAAFGLGPLARAAKPAGPAADLAKFRGKVNAGPWPGDPCPNAGVRCIGYTDNRDGTVTLHFVGGF